MDITGIMWIAESQLPDRRFCTVRFLISESYRMSCFYITRISFPSLIMTIVPETSVRNTRAPASARRFSVA